MAHVEANVGVTALVSRSSMDDPSQGAAGGWTIGLRCKSTLRVVAVLLVPKRLGSCRRWNAHTCPA